MPDRNRTPDEVLDDEALDLETVDETLAEETPDEETLDQERVDEETLDEETLDEATIDEDRDEITIRDEGDPNLGLTNVPGHPPQDWAADTGPSRTAAEKKPSDRRRSRLQKG